MDDRPENIGALMAVDFGLKRTGLAICDPERRVAVGIGVIKDKTGRSLARSICQEANLRNISKIVIGFPKFINQQTSDITLKIEQLCSALEKLGKKVERWNEDYSTAEALSSKRYYGISSKSKAGWEDESAAILILQNYLDWLKNKRNRCDQEK